MADEPNGFIGRRLDHPIFGSIAASFLIWNWPLVVWFVGAISEPSQAVIGMTSYFSAESYTRLYFWPLAFGLGYAFVAPLLFAWYKIFDEFMIRLKTRIEGRSRQLGPVHGKAFITACDQLDRYETQLKSYKALFEEIDHSITPHRNTLRRISNQVGIKMREELAPIIISLQKIRDDAIRLNSTIDVVQKGTLAGSSPARDIRAKGHASRWYQS